MSAVVRPPSTNLVVMPRPARLPCTVTGCAELKPCPAHPVVPWAQRSPRARNRAGSGWAQSARRLEVLKRYGSRCAECGRDLPPSLLEIDHVQPVAEGGADALPNLRPLCPPCHRAKTAAEAARGRARARRGAR